MICCGERVSRHDKPERFRVIAFGVPVMHHRNGLPVFRPFVKAENSEYGNSCNRTGDGLQAGFVLPDREKDSRRKGAADKPPLPASDPSAGKKRPVQEEPVIVMTLPRYTWQVMLGRRGQTESDLDRAPSQGALGELKKDIKGLVSCCSFDVLFRCL